MVRWKLSLDIIRDGSLLSFANYWSPTMLITSYLTQSLGTPWTVKSTVALSLEVVGTSISGSCTAMFSCWSSKQDLVWTGFGCSLIGPVVTGGTDEVLAVKLFW